MHNIGKDPVVLLPGVFWGTCALLAAATGMPRPYHAVATAEIRPAASEARRRRLRRSPTPVTYARKVKYVQVVDDLRVAAATVSAFYATRMLIELRPHMGEAWVFSRMDRPIHTAFRLYYHKGIGPSATDPGEYASVSAARRHDRERRRLTPSAGPAAAASQAGRATMSRSRAVEAPRHPKKCWSGVGEIAAGKWPSQPPFMIPRAPRIEHSDELRPPMRRRRPRV